MVLASVILYDAVSVLKKARRHGRQPELLEELMRYSAPLSRRIIGALAQRLMRMNQSAAG
jgi:Zn-finger domain-containing protein